MQKEFWILTRNCRKNDMEWLEIFSTEELAKAALAFLPVRGKDKYEIDQENSWISKATFTA